MAKRFNIAVRDMEEALQKHIDEFAEGDRMSSMVSALLDRSYYNYSSDPAGWVFPESGIKYPMQWIRMDQLPVGEHDGDYRPKERMQGLFSGLQSLGRKMAFLLERENGFTRLYLGVYSGDGGDAAEQLKQMAQQNLTGAKFSAVENWQPEQFMRRMTNYGIVTGQPSARWNERENPLQNIDKLARGFRSENGSERNYAVLIIADPAGDGDVKDVLDRIQRLQSELHDYAKWSESYSLQKQQGVSSFKSVSLSASLIMLAVTAACICSGIGIAALPIMAKASGAVDLGQAMSAGLSANFGRSKSQSAAFSHSVSSEHVNYAVQYCIGLLDKLVKRMEQGRNLGFWNTGVYVLGDASSTVDLVSATVRSIYSGQDSYLEPLRTFNLGNSQTVARYIMNMQLLPLPTDENLKALAASVDEGESWHILGPMYEKLSTPVNTEELSIMMSLPKTDVAGLRIKREAVEFSTNPPDTEGMRTIALGEIMNMGAGTGHPMLLDIDQLNSHGIIVGMNGGGKSVTNRRIITGMINNGIPFMVIDPVKTDYVRWADEYNRKNEGKPGFKPILIFAPGMTSIPGISTKLSKLKMNPFQPFSMTGAPMNMLDHVGALLALLQKVLAMGEFLPMLLEEAVYNYMEGTFGPKVMSGAEFMPAKDQMYPTLSGLQKQVVMLLQDRQYAQENTQNFTAAIQTRINSLTRGWKHDFFESRISTKPEEIFENNVVICLAGVSSNSDKAFLMSLLLQALGEYRNSKYLYDKSYREAVEKGRSKHRGSCLMHYTVVEEAHRILQRSMSLDMTNDPQAAISEKFSEMLSEIRETGEGMMIVDQYPSRLIPDAIKNTNVKLIHKLQARDDIEAMATSMSLDDRQSKLIASLERGNAIVNPGLDDASTWVKVYYNR